jgi:hypothetical protein
MNEKRRTGRLGGFELLAQEEADIAYRNVMEMRDQPFGDSPIEHLFYAALQTVAQREHRTIVGISRFGKGALPNGRDYSLEKARDGERAFGRPDHTAYIEKQVQVAGWRVDFVLHYPLYRLGRDDSGDIRLTRLIVECDGHAFHERTKDQAARDRSRDRLAQYEGLPIFRFTGAEIWNDPAECADEVLAFMERE